MVTRATPGSSAALLARYENTPPLFYLLLTPVRLDDGVWVRWPSIAAGVAAVPVLYAAVRTLLGPRGPGCWRRWGWPCRRWRAFSD
jgi:hypothetical protein